MPALGGRGFCQYEKMLGKCLKIDGSPKIDGWLSDEPNTGLMGEKRCGLGRWRGLMGLALGGRSTWGG